MRQVNAEIIPDLCLMLMIILFKLEIQTKRERSLGVRALMNVTDLQFENTGSMRTGMPMMSVSLSHEVPLLERLLCL